MSVLNAKQKDVLCLALMCVSLQPNTHIYIYIVVPIPLLVVHQFATESAG